MDGHVGSHDPRPGGALRDRIRTLLPHHVVKSLLFERLLLAGSGALLGALTPLGNPQNLFLYTRGGFRLSEFLANQAPWVEAAAVLLGAVPILVPKRALAHPSTSIRFWPAPASFSWRPRSRRSSVRPHHWVPLVLAFGGAGLLGRRIREADFSLVFVFALVSLLLV